MSFFVELPLLKKSSSDKVACLFTGLSEHPNTQIGLIIGTGFNISFLKPRGEGSNPDVVNSELGKTDIDLSIDPGPLKPNVIMFI